MRKLALVSVFLLACAAAVPQEVIVALRHPVSGGGGGSSAYIKTTSSTSTSLTYTCTPGHVLYFVADDQGSNPATWPSVASSTDSLTLVSGSAQGGGYRANVNMFTATCGGSGSRTVSWTGGGGGTLFSAVAEFSGASSTVVTSGIGGSGYSGTAITVSGTNGSGGTLAILGYGSASNDALSSCGGGFVSAGGAAGTAEIWYNSAMASGSFSFNCNLTTGASTDTFTFASFQP